MYRPNITSPGSQQGVAVGEKGPNQQDVDRQTGRTAHQRGDEDRGQPIAAVLDHPRRQDAGHGTGHRRQQAG